MGLGMRTALLGLLAISCASATTHCVTIAGLGGEPDYEQRFAAWAQDLDKTFRATPDSHVETFTGAKSTKQSIRATFESIAKQAKADDALVVVLIGHGSFDG